ncbi:DUF4031 domain-containing protein [Georgenia sunbinii]|uniref:DUF4031 domain-containing protein n=1 Tax=Georgenia sunbinii TaxID=3117728 RepID=UPI002F26C32A
MAILIDDPRWPAHGTVWAHLVSDSSLTELHDFAGATGLPPRSFDLDHYDVPAERWPELVAAGAQPVDRAELVRRLRASGLRVIGADRPARRRLLAQWRDLVPDAEDTGHQLLNRWAAPGRAYHGVDHLRAVLQSLTVLADGGEKVAHTVTVAAWFHDAVHDGASPADELASAALAVSLLDGALPGPEVEEVARLVRLTIDHDPSPGDPAGQALCDADLAVLGGSPALYRRYAEQVREEYAAVPDAAFRAGRAAILGRILTSASIYRTTTGRHRWEAAARRNVAAELAELTS